MENSARLVRLILLQLLGLSQVIDAGNCPAGRTHPLVAKTTDPKDAYEEVGEQGTTFHFNYAVGGDGCESGAFVAGYLENTAVYAHSKSTIAMVIEKKPEASDQKGKIGIFNVYRTETTVLPSYWIIVIFNGRLNSFDPNFKWWCGYHVPMVAYFGIWWKFPPTISTRLGIGREYAEKCIRHDYEANWNKSQVKDWRTETLPIAVNNGNPDACRFSCKNTGIPSKEIGCTDKTGKSVACYDCKNAAGAYVDCKHESCLGMHCIVNMKCSGRTHPLVAKTTDPKDAYEEVGEQGTTFHFKYAVGGDGCESGAFVVGYLENAAVYAHSKSTIAMVIEKKPEASDQKGKVGIFNVYRPEKTILPSFWIIVILNGRLDYVDPGYKEWCAYHLPMVAYFGIWWKNPPTRSTRLAFGRDYAEKCLRLFNYEASFNTSTCKDWRTESLPLAVSNGNPDACRFSCKNTGLPRKEIGCTDKTGKSVACYDCKNAAGAYVDCKHESCLGMHCIVNMKCSGVTKQHWNLTDAILGGSTTALAYTTGPEAIQDCKTGSFMVGGFKNMVVYAHSTTSVVIGISPPEKKEIRLYPTYEDHMAGITGHPFFRTLMVINGELQYTGDKIPEDNSEHCIFQIEGSAQLHDWSQPKADPCYVQINKTYTQTCKRSLDYSKGIWMTEYVPGSQVIDPKGCKLSCKNTGLPKGKDCKDSSGSQVDCKDKNCIGKDCEKPDCKDSSGSQVDCKDKNCIGKDCEKRDCKDSSGSQVDCKDPGCIGRDCEKTGGNTKDCKDASGKPIDCKDKNCIGKDCQRDGGNGKDCKDKNGHPIDCRSSFCLFGKDCLNHNGTPKDCKDSSGKQIDCSDSVCIGKDCHIEDSPKFDEYGEDGQIIKLPDPFDPGFSFHNEVGENSKQNYFRRLVFYDYDPNVPSITSTGGNNGKNCSLVNTGGEHLGDHNITITINVNQEGGFGNYTVTTTDGTGSNGNSIDSNLMMEVLDALD